jgi:hypothetical protein
MKKIIMSSLLAINLLYGNNIALDQSIKDKIITLDNEQEYLTARELLKDFIDKNNKIDSLKFWLEQDEKIFNNLYFENKGLTYIDSQNIITKKEIEKDTTISGISQLIPIVGLVTTGYMANKYNNKINEKKEYLDNYYIPLYNIEKAKYILKEFDFLKKSQDRLNYILKEYIKQANTQEFKHILPLLKEVKNFKNKIKTRRSNFISYTVISPYLANAQKYIMLSNLDNLIGHNEEYLKKAARSMAKGAYKDILLESNEDVREQFYTVFQKLKDTAGEKEWEDLKVLQTLMNSSSNAKKTGADKWWE